MKTTLLHSQLYYMTAHNGYDWSSDIKTQINPQQRQDKPHWMEDVLFFSTSSDLLIQTTFIKWNTTWLFYAITIHHSNHKQYDY